MKWLISQIEMTVKQSEDLLLWSARRAAVAMPPPPRHRAVAWKICFCSKSGFDGCCCRNFHHQDWPSLRDNDRHRRCSHGWRHPALTHTRYIHTIRVRLQLKILIAWFISNFSNLYSLSIGNSQKKLVAQKYCVVVHQINVCGGNK